MKKYIGILLGVVLVYGLAILGIYMAGAKSKEPLPNKHIYFIPGARLYGKIPSPALEERLMTAFHAGGKDAYYMVSGGQGHDEDIPEGEAMKLFLIEKGVSEDHIYAEFQSTSTYENLKQSLPVLREFHHVVVVTNRFHVGRTKMLARRLGLSVSGIGAPTPPTARLKSYVREVPAFIKSFLFDRN